MENQETAEATSDLIGNKILNKFDKIHNKIVQKQLQINMIKKDLKKDIYLIKKYRKLLITWD